ncbi:SPJ_0845 family protein [Lacticaseibacillus mingshuiensis]|uniref:SPJ_0845 family protein n=1 Tax=Lacticaseibacillus mingshuiensis TaxID=2799574 RepID=A0ABW4CG17_9LACO|nr:SPJ_0845 family protein [Lacticaseibacillus mingshuiensis]
MGLTRENKTDWGNLFDKFATMPDVATGADPKKQAELAAKAKALKAVADADNAAQQPTPTDPADQSTDENKN